ncbi:MAG: VWA domain-containing protein, partial [Nitrospiraceae bacterium]
MKITLIVRIMLIVALLAGSSCLLPSVIHADGDSGVDVVIVMDSSGSMKKTDPASLRIHAARLFISLLGKHDRAGVVSFSDRGYPLLGLTHTDSEENREKLVSAVSSISSDGRYTNLYAALYEGLSLLSHNRRAGGTPIIILMSDGMMDVGDPAEDRRLAEEIRNKLSVMLEGEQIRVYTIAFTKHSDRALLEKISKLTGGFHNLALTDGDFHLVFASIFESLKSPDMLPIGDNGFLIDSSVTEVTIVTTKESPDTQVRLTDPAGSTYSSGDTSAGLQWFASERFDMITVREPREGRWSLLFSSPEDNRAYIITNLSLQTSFDKLYATFGEPLDIRIWLERDGSTITEQEVLEKIEFALEMTGPDGAVTELKPFAQKGGMYSRRIAPFTPGNHTIRVVARGKTFEREKTAVFNVAGVAESKIDILAEREKMARAAAAREKPEPKQHSAGTISWVRVTIQFMGINLVLAALAFVYFRAKARKARGPRGTTLPPDDSTLITDEAQTQVLTGTPAASEETSPQHEIPLDDKEEAGKKEKCDDEKAESTKA